MDPASDLFTIFKGINNDPRAHTPWLDAYSRGNTLLCFPREIHDKVYDMDFEGDYKGSIVISDPPGIIRACKQLSHEVEPYYINNSRIVIDDKAELLKTQHWFSKRVSCDGLKAVQTVVFTSLEMLLQYNGYAKWINLFFKRCENIRTFELVTNIASTNHGLADFGRPFPCSFITPWMLSLHNFRIVMSIAKSKTIILDFAQDSVPIKGDFELRAWMVEEFRRQRKEVEVIQLHHDADVMA